MKICYVIVPLNLDPYRWLDKLGLGARKGLDIVMRQVLVGSGSYHMIDNNLDPLPVWPPKWTESVLVYKRIILFFMICVINWGKLWLHHATPFRITGCPFSTRDSLDRRFCKYKPFLILVKVKEWGCICTAPTKRGRPRNTAATTKTKYAQTRLWLEETHCVIHKS